VFVSDSPTPFLQSVGDAVGNAASTVAHVVDGAVGAAARTANHLGSTVATSIDTAQGNISYVSADVAAAIGAEYEAVRILVDQLLDDLDDMPHASAVRTDSGPTTGTASTFAVPLDDAMLAAANATRALRTEVTETMHAVRLTLDELAKANSEAARALDGMRGQLAEDEASTPQVPHATAPTVPASQPSTGNQMRG
jgi:hypothetical protein